MEALWRAEARRALQFTELAQEPNLLVYIAAPTYSRCVLFRPFHDRFVEQNCIYFVPISTYMPACPLKICRRTMLFTTWQEYWQKTLSINIIRQPFGEGRGNLQERSSLAAGLQQHNQYQH